MGGEFYNHHGGGANYLCLPHSPKYDKYQDGYQYAGYMYGTEYEVAPVSTADTLLSEVSITMKHPALSALLSHVVQC